MDAVAYATLERVDWFNKFAWRLYGPMAVTAVKASESPTSDDIFRSNTGRVPTVVARHFLILYRMV